MAMVYLTAAKREDLLRIGNILVEERLAACVNVLGEITSVFRWEGQVQQEAEVAAFLKTSTEKLSALINRIKELHDYSCPCVVSWEISEGNPDFLKWVQQQTQH